MIYKKSSLLFLIIMTFSIGVVVASTGKPLNKAELQKILIGHTYPFSKGDGMYFSSADKAIISYQGKTENVKWHATNDSKFCYTAVVFGGKEECIGLTRSSDGNYVHDYYGKYRTINASKIKKGKSF